MPRKGLRGCVVVGALVTPTTRYGGAKRFAAPAKNRGIRHIAGVPDPGPPAVRNGTRRVDRRRIRRGGGSAFAGDSNQVPARAARWKGGDATVRDCLHLTQRSARRRPLVEFRSGTGATRGRASKVNAARVGNLPLRAPFSPELLLSLGVGSPPEGARRRRSGASSGACALVPGRFGWTEVSAWRRVSSGRGRVSPRRPCDWGRASGRGTTFPRRNPLIRHAIRSPADVSPGPACSPNRAPSGDSAGRAGRPRSCDAGA